MQKLEIDAFSNQTKAVVYSESFVGIIIQNIIVLNVNNFNIFVNLMQVLKRVDFFVC